MIQDPFEQWLEQFLNTQKMPLGDRIYACATLEKARKDDESYLFKSDEDRQLKLIGYALGELSTDQLQNPNALPLLKRYSQPRNKFGLEYGLFVGDYPGETLDEHLADRVIQSNDSKLNSIQLYHIGDGRTGLPSLFYRTAKTICTILVPSDEPIAYINNEQQWNYSHAPSLKPLLESFEELEGRTADSLTLSLIEKKLTELFKL